MNKKGFTLIELLAVIVILAIIALIATPIVLNIINDTSEQADLISADFYLDALELSIAQATLEGQNITDGTYNILGNGNICLEEYDSTNKKCTDGNDSDTDVEELKVEVKGEVPKKGTVTITNGKIDEVSFVLNTKEITKNSKGQLVYVKTLDEVCEYKEGPKGEISSKYECKVDPNKDAYTFYILSYLDANGDIIKDKTNAISVNLIMDQNINSDGTPAGMTAVSKTENPNQYNLESWINKGDYESVGGQKWNYIEDSDMNKFGPITAMNFLSEATKTWTNTNEIKTSTIAYEDGTTYTMPKTYYTNARMPIYSTDALKTEVVNKTESNAYLYTNLEYGYWTISPRAVSTYNVWYVYYDGYVNHLGVYHADKLGLRPVITLKI